MTQQPRQLDAPPFPAREGGSGGLGRPRSLRDPSRPPDRLSLIWIAALLLALLLTACAPDTTAPDRSAERLKASGTLKVAIDPSFPPFASLDEQGEIVGFDADLSRELARRLGVDAEFVPSDVGSIFDTLTAGKVDLIVSAIPPYREHSRRVRYSPPYYNAGQVVLVRRSTGSGAGASLDGKVVGYEFGTGGEVVLRTLPRERGVPTELRSFTSPEAAIDALAGGHVDAVVTDRVLARLAIKSNPALEIAGAPLDVDPYVVASRRQDVWLARVVDDILQELESEGFLRELEDRWL